MEFLLLGEVNMKAELRHLWCMVIITVLATVVVIIGGSPEFVFADKRETCSYTCIEYYPPEKGGTCKKTKKTCESEHHCHTRRVQKQKCKEIYKYPGKIPTGNYECVNYWDTEQYCHS